jgi:tRNA (cytidine/uridine-2'-O-)-methyltransferase
MWGQPALRRNGVKSGGILTWIARGRMIGGGMFNIVLLEPEIPHNAGAAGRLALATGSSLNLIKPLGFSLEDKYVKRTGLDYWQDVDLHVWGNFEEFRAGMADSRLWFLSTKARISPWQADFLPGDCLVFGRETKGLPEDLIAAAGDRALRIPMRPGSTRSLNLSTAVAIVLYEAVRQQSPDWG